MLNDPQVSVRNGPGPYGLSAVNTTSQQHHNKVKHKGLGTRLERGLHVGNIGLAARQRHTTFSAGTWAVLYEEFWEHISPFSFLPLSLLPTSPHSAKQMAVVSLAADTLLRYPLYLLFVAPFGIVRPPS